MNELQSHQFGGLFNQKVSFEIDGIKTGMFKTYNVFQRLFKSKEELVDVTDSKGNVFVLDRRMVESFSDSRVYFEEYPLSDISGNELINRILKEFNGKPKNIQEVKDFEVQLFNDTGTIQTLSGLTIRRYDGLTGSIMAALGFATPLSSKEGVWINNDNYKQVEKTVYVSTSDLNNWLDSLEDVPINYNSNKKDRPENAPTIAGRIKHLRNTSRFIDFPSFVRNEVMGKLGEINNRRAQKERKKEEEEGQLMQELAKEPDEHSQMEYSQIREGEDSYKVPQSLSQSEYSKLRSGDANFPFARRSPVNPENIETAEDYSQLKQFMEQPKIPPNQSKSSSDIKRHGEETKNASDISIDPNKKPKKYDH